MSEKKVGKRLLTWVLVLVMTLSLLPLNVLADETASSDVKIGHYNENGNWTEGAPIQNLPMGVDSVNKTAEPTGTPNEYTVTLQVQMHTTTETQTSYAQAATVLVIDTSGSMSYCLQPEHEHNDSCYNVTETECSHSDHKRPKNGKIYTHEDGTRCICSKSGIKSNYYVLDWTCRLDEHKHKTGCGGDNSRLDTAKSAAIDFLDSYREGSGRLAVLVSFSNGAEEKCVWQDVSTPDGYTAIENAINNLSAGGGTNLEQGLTKAQDLLGYNIIPNTASKNIIALTDGKPTYYNAPHSHIIPDSYGQWTYPDGDGQDCDKETFEATKNKAAEILAKDYSLYSICFGAANEEVTVPNTNTKISLLDYLGTYIAPGKTYSAGDFTGLKDAFDAISKDITSGLSSGTVKDRLPAGITSTDFGAKTEWNLSEADGFTCTTETTGNTTYYTYTKTYTVMIDPENETVKEIAAQNDGYYPLNGETTLTVGEDVVIDFPIPAGKVTLPKYTVTYKVDGQQVGEVETYNYGDPVTIRDKFVKEGYEVSDWSSNDVTFSNGSFSMPAHDVEITANSSIKSYTVTYKVDGQQVGEVETYKFGDPVTIREKYVKEGYEVSDWSITENFNMPAHDVEITANSSIKSYTVTYKVDGQQVGEVETYNYGDPVTIRDKFVKEGYEVSDWSSNDVTFSNGSFSMPAHDVEITANSSIKSYTVTYKVDGQQVGEVETYKFGDPVTIREKYVKEGYTVSDWSRTENFTMPAENVVIAATSTANTYTVTWKNYDGTVLEEDKNVPYGTTPEYNSATPTRPASGRYTYTFKSWDKDLAPVTGDVIYTATYTETYHRPSTPPSRPSTPTVVIPDDDALGLNTTDHFAYIVGYGNGEVRPQNNITRAEVATIFFRLLTDDVRDENLTKTNRYSDVVATSWYNTAVSTLSSMGIITGYPDGTFRPNAAITRAEFAAIAARFDNDGDKTAAKFSDIANHWARDEISIAYNNGWITGYPDGTFGPQRDITRAETMTLVNRVLNRQPETEEDLLPNMTVWTDNANPKAWYYLAVQEATNSHYYEFKTNSKYEKWTELRETRDWTLLEK